MSTGTRSHAELTSDPEPTVGPKLSRCETSPGKFVFLEPGNTDGWIASDTTVDVSR